MFILQFLKKLHSVAIKIFIVVTVFFTVISLFLYFITKDKPVITHDPVKKNREEIYKVINDQKFNSTKEGKLTILIYRLITCQIIGEACTDRPEDGNKNYQHSLFGKMAGFISMPYTNPPASSAYWAYAGLQNAGFIPKTYAAEGIGFATIKPFMSLWKVMRDISYMFLVLVLIAIGFMIMFRMKLNPQTVISIESALPRIIISLILITFSFAIAGFLIDLMYIMVAITIAILSNGNTFYNASDFQNGYIAASGWGIFQGIAGGSALGYNFFKIGAAILGLIPTEITWLLNVIGGLATIVVTDLIFKHRILGDIPDGLNGIAILGNTLGNLPGALIKPGWNLLIIIITFLLGIVVFWPLVMGIFILLTVLLIFFRIFFLLLTSYLKLLIYVIFAPIFMLFEAIPGKSVFSFWFKNMIGFLIAFPLTIIIFILTYIIISTPTSYFTIRFPFLYGIDTESFKIFLGMGLAFITPDLIKMTKELLSIKEIPVPLSVGTFFGGASTGISGGAGLLGQISSINLGLGAIMGGQQGGLKALIDKLRGK